MSRLGVAPGEQFQQRKYADVEVSLRRALGLDRALTVYLDPAFAVQVRGSLAALLMGEHREDEAREVAKPICALPDNAPGLDSRVRTLRQALCR